jgi:hypothetical protein
MGYSFDLLGKVGSGDAMEGKFCDGRTDTLRDSVEGRGEYGLPVQRVRDSPKTGYKILDRYDECGLEGLTDRARRPHRYANSLPAQGEAAIVPNTRSRAGVHAKSGCACCGGCPLR